MSLPDTPNLTVFYCPGCSPERDPLEEMLIVRWCDPHRPPEAGVDDERAQVSKDVLTSTGEAEGGSNRLWCRLLHGGRRRRRARQ